MPQYKKVFDIGTYTGNGYQYRIGMPTLRGPGSSNGQVANSLRFRASNSNLLTKTFGAAGNRQKMTFSFWVKRSINTNPGGSVYGSDWSGGGLSQGGAFIKFYSGQMYVTNETSNGYDWYFTTKVGLFNDTSKWYHVVVAFDTTQATASNRVRIYIDNLEVTSFTNNSPPSQNYSTKFNGTALRIGAQDSSGSAYDYFDGYLADFNFIDGTQLTPSSFAEYNSDGIWVPKPITGLTYGTNGYYLKFAPAAVGTDSSGNGNTWTLNGFNVTTSNTTYDLLTDSPTDYNSSADTGVGAQVRGNFAVASAGDTFFDGGSIAWGGLQITCSQWLRTRASIGVSSGKWYWETTHEAYDQSYQGIASANWSMGTNNALGTDNQAGALNACYYQSGSKYINGTSSAYGSSFTIGDTIGYALDMDAGTLTCYKNNVSQGVLVSGLTTYGTIFPAFSVANGAKININFGQRAFTYTAPTGFKTLCTANLPRPADSSMWFYGDTPDFVWIKNRTTSGYHILVDTVRGMGLNLYTASTAAEVSYPAVTEMNKFGMTLINDATSIVNGATNSHIYWAWKAGSNTSSTSVTNTNGSITSQVSANPTTGFSIVNFTGTGSAGTVGHGLGAAPNFIILKNRDITSSWRVGHSSLTSWTYTLYFDGSAQTSASTDWNATPPTSSVFSVGTNNGVNGSGNKSIAYCWTAIPGYSAFGSYTGNGSTDGAFVYLGFRPRWLMTKNISTGATDWEIMDTTRDIYNPIGTYLTPDGSTADASSTLFDFTANGFKLRTSASTWNASGSTYVYAAFAEIPFKYARAR